jgi:hypothetical protein
MKNKKFAAVGAFILTIALTTCSGSPASATPLKLNNETIGPDKVSLMDLLLSKQEPEGIIAEQAAKIELEAEKQRVLQEKLDNNSLLMDKAIKKLRKYVGSQYGYGETPGYWDCSGLVRWFYLQQGIELYHSASVEARSGKRVKHPKIGDLVSFHYGSIDYSFHIGIYIGDGKVLHAYNPYRDTVIDDVDKVANENNAWASYTRIVETN